MQALQCKWVLCSPMGGKAIQHFTRGHYWRAKTYPPLPWFGLHLQHWRSCRQTHTPAIHKPFLHRHFLVDVLVLLSLFHSPLVPEEQTQGTAKTQTNLFQKFTAWSSFPSRAGLPDVCIVTLEGIATHSEVPQDVPVAPPACRAGRHQLESSKTGAPGKEATETGLPQEAVTASTIRTNSDKEGKGEASQKACLAAQNAL